MIQMPILLNKNNQTQFLDWYNNIPENGGFLLIDKAKNWTSFDAVAKIRNVLRIKKIGHGGTLDPLATGLLLICLGRKATKLSTQYQNMPKTYYTTIKLGYVTKSYDLETEEEFVSEINNITEDNILQTLNSFLGEIQQVPPLYSAISVNGIRAYKLARNDSDTVLEPRNVTIYSISDIQINLPFVSFAVECSKGTYIRTLADDIGKKLGCGAYLSELRRTQIADFNVEDALTVDDIINFKNEQLTI